MLLDDARNVGVDHVQVRMNQNIGSSDGLLHEEVWAHPLLASIGFQVIDRKDARWKLRWCSLQSFEEFALAALRGPACSDVATCRIDLLGIRQRRHFRIDTQVFPRREAHSAQRAQFFPLELPVCNEASKLFHRLGHLDNCPRAVHNFALVVRMMHQVGHEQRQQRDGLARSRWHFKHHVAFAVQPFL